MLTLAVEDLEYVGEQLERPETVLATRSGDIFMPDKRGGISVVRADGRTELILARNAPAGFLPNGFALLPDRSFLIADLGNGGVWHMSQDGRLTPRLMEIDGRRLEPTNFVGIDAQGPHLGLRQHPAGAARAVDAQGPCRRLHHPDRRRRRAGRGRRNRLHQRSDRRSDRQVALRQRDDCPLHQPFSDRRRRLASASARCLPSTAPVPGRTASPSMPRAASGSSASSAIG